MHQLNLHDKTLLDNKLRAHMSVFFFKFDIGLLFKSSAEVCLWRRDSEQRLCWQSKKSYHANKSVWIELNVCVCLAGDSVSLTVLLLCRCKTVPARCVSSGQLLPPHPVRSESNSIQHSAKKNIIFLREGNFLQVTPVLVKLPSGWKYLQ